MTDDAALISIKVVNHQSMHTIPIYTIFAADYNTDTTGDLIIDTIP